MSFDLFPESSLAASFIVPVWIGVWIICLLNLRLGWAASGLVVPGLLAPLLMWSPLTTVVLVAEAAATYGLVKGLSRALPRYFDASHLFGRDRFFAMLIASVFVRLFSELWLLPGPIAQLATFAGGSLDAEAISGGIALVIVPLLANQWWKPGWVTGGFSTSVCIGLTWLILRFLVVPYTNFDLNNLMLQVEALNTQVDASAKSYIILLITAYLSSRLNLLHGWELGGILFPALLALTWFDPSRLLATLLETALLVVLGHYALKVSWLKEAGAQGASRILLFFNIAMLYRFVVGHLVQNVAPDVWGSDFLGVGFMISALLASRIAGRGVGVQLVRTLGQTSLSGAGVGVAISLALYCVHGFAPDFIGKHIGFTKAFAEDFSSVSDAQDRMCPQARVPAVPRELKFSSDQSSVAFLKSVARGNPDFFASARSERYLMPSVESLHGLRADVLRPLLEAAKSFAWKQTHEIDASQLRALIEPIAIAARSYSFELSVISGSADRPYRVALIDGDTTKSCHRGLVLLTIGRANPISVHVSRPEQEFRSLESGLKIFDASKAIAFVAPAAHPQANTDGSADVTQLSQRQNLFVLMTEELVRAFSETPLALLDMHTFSESGTTAIPSSVSPVADLVLAGDQLHSLAALDPKEDASSVSSSTTPLNQILPGLIKAIASAGHVVAIQDGSETFAAAARPLPLMESIASRGERSFAVAASLHPLAARQLLPVLNDSVWEARWKQLGREVEVIDTRTIIDAAAKDPSSQGAAKAEAHRFVRDELMAFLDDFNALRIVRIESHAPTISIRLIEDEKTAKQYFLIEDTSHPKREIFELYGRGGVSL